MPRLPQLRALLIVALAAAPALVAGSARAGDLTDAALSAVEREMEEIAREAESLEERFEIQPAEARSGAEGDSGTEAKAPETPASAAGKESAGIEGKRSPAAGSEVKKAPKRKAPAPGKNRN